MESKDRSLGRTVVLFGEALTAAAIMSRIAPAENGLAAFVLWTFLFASLLAPGSLCSRLTARLS